MRCIVERKYNKDHVIAIYHKLNGKVDCSINVDTSWCDDIYILFNSIKGHYPVINVIISELHPDLKAYEYNELVGVLSYDYHDFNMDYYNPKSVKCYKLSINNFLHKLEKLTGIDYGDKFVNTFCIER